jgi:hypothetical protein
MPTITDICNAAISHCGTRSKISSIDEGSAEANACLTHLAMVRDATLRAFDWNFARMTVALARLEAPPKRWACKYALPVDCVRIRRLNDVPVLIHPETAFELAADKDATGAYISVLLSNEAAVSAIYTARVEDPLRWDQGFVDAVAYGLASRIAFELTGKEERQATLVKLWQAALREGAAAAANESSTLDRVAPPEAAVVRGYVS